MVENEINAGIELLVDETREAINSTIGVFIRGFQSEISRALAPVPALAAAINNFGDCVLGLDGILEGLEEVKALLRIEVLRVDLEMLRIEDMSERIASSIQGHQDKVGGLGDWVLDRVQDLVDEAKERIHGQLWNFWFSFGFGMLVTLLGIVRVAFWFS